MICLSIRLFIIMTIPLQTEWPIISSKKEKPLFSGDRLDRDTTGLLILAKNALSASILSNDMKARKIHRTYQAVVSRIPVPAFGTIDAPIARKEDSAIERCVDFEKGEPAVTHYRTLETKENLALVELSLETGRTHQIRVHMQHMGCPLLGDYLYLDSL